MNFTVHHDCIVWDPMIVQNPQHELHNREVLALVARRDTQDGTPFFLRPNSLVRFVEDSAGVWHAKSHVKCGDSNSRWCAGSAVFQGGKYHLFLSSSTLCQDTIDQGLVYIQADKDFNLLTSWEYEPDGYPFLSSRLDPEGQIVHACRDPYYVRDNDRHFLFVCTGGFRWNSPPGVVLLQSDSIDGIYEPVLEHPVFRDPNDGIHKFAEVERVSVVKHNHCWYMLFHCWHNGVTFRSSGTGRLHPASDNSTVWVAEAPSLTGPYFMKAEGNFTSKVPYLYGSQFLQDGLYTYGVYWDYYYGTSCPRGWIQVDWNDRTIKLAA